MALTAYDHTLVGACEVIRKEAENLAGANYAFNLGRINGALDMITSPDNGGVQTELISPQGSKIAQLKVLYDQPSRACQASTSLNTNVCNDTAISPTRKQFIKSIGKKITSPTRSFTNDQLVTICKGSKEFVQSWLMNDLRATRERLNEVVLAELNAMVGKQYHWDGTETVSGSFYNLQLLLSSSGQDLPQPANYVTIEQDFKNMKLTGLPAVIGNGYFDRYMRLNQLACCNTSTPYAQAVQAAGSAYFYDHVINDVIGNNKILVLPFGIVHFLTFNENKNIQEMFGKGDLGPEIHTVIPDPAGYPFEWNFDMKWDCTTKTWKYQYSFHWDIFNIYQPDSFASDTGTPDCSDDLLGMTGVFGYQITRG
jgi:hypothetical protein